MIQQSPSSPHPLLNVKWGIPQIINYRGVLITKLIGGYEVLGFKVSTTKEVDEVIDKGIENLSRTILKTETYNVQTSI